MNIICFCYNWYVWTRPNPCPSQESSQPGWSGPCRTWDIAASHPPTRGSQTCSPNIDLGPRFSRFLKNQNLSEAPRVLEKNVRNILDWSMGTLGWLPPKKQHNYNMRMPTAKNHIENRKYWFLPPIHSLLQSSNLPSHSRCRAPKYYVAHSLQLPWSSPRVELRPAKAASWSATSWRLLSSVPSRVFFANLPWRSHKRRTNPVSKSGDHFWKTNSKQLEKWGVCWHKWAFR